MNPLYEVKFGAYLLASAALHGILGKLWKVADDEPEFAVEDLIASYEQRLQEFFNNWHSENPRKTYAEMLHVVDELTHQARVIHPAAGAVLLGGQTWMAKAVKSWDPFRHLADLHDAALDVARDFFGGCHPLADRLPQQCRCDMEVRKKQEGEPYMLYSREQSAIEALFFFQSGEPHFRWYLALPFRFLHEYTAHIYALDPGFEVFSDGWMIFAAAQFMEDSWLACRPAFRLSEDQAHVFRRSIQSTLPPMPQKGMHLAGHVHAMLNSAMKPATFLELTHRLCSIKPKGLPRERKRLAQVFMAQLARALESDSGRAGVRRAAIKGSDALIRHLV